jgi:drug/metabolite transporter (DMT)-like permease
MFPPRTRPAADRRPADTVRVVAIFLALLSSVLWGVADFSGGTASRRLPALVVVLGSQAVGLAAAAVAATVARAWDEPLGYLPWAIGAGLVGAAGLVGFYRALAVGTMGVVSPIAALGVIVPVAVGLATGHWPSAVVGAGFVLAVIGVVASSGPERAQGRSLRPVVLAIGAAVCFGATLLFIDGGAGHSPVMTMVAMRVASVLPLGLLCLAMRARSRAATAAGVPIATGVPIPDGGPDPQAAAGVARTGAARAWAVVVVAGLFDVSANLAFAVASTRGTLAVVAILGSLYPAVTVLLARIIHTERLTRLQQAGVLVALVGVALIAGWS